MQLTKHTDLALRVLMYLAVNPGALAKIKDISTVYKVSQNHLVKVVHKLVLLGYVHSTRGRGGGVILAKNPKAISVGEIVKKMENSIEIIDCKKENCPLMSNCLLKRALNVATNDFLSSLDKQTIHDLVKNLKSSSIAINTEEQISPIIYKERENEIFI